MAAALGKLLVLDLDAGGARPLVAPHRVLHVQGAAEAGVRIGDQGRRRPLGDLADPADHVLVGRIAGIRHSQQRGGDAIAGHVHRLETEAVGEPGRDHVVDPGRGDEAALAETFLQ